MSRAPEPRDERGAILRLAGELATLRQTVTDQMVEVLVAVGGVAEEVDELRARQGELIARVDELAARARATSVTEVHDGADGAEAESAPTGLPSGDELAELVSAAVRDVLGNQSAALRDAVRTEVERHGGREGRVVGAGLTTLASRLGEEVASLREVLLDELDGWFEELPSEARLTSLSARLDELSQRLGEVDGGVRADATRDVDGGSVR